MKNKTALRTVNNLIFGLVAFVTLMVPVMFLTATYDFFEFNKLYFFILTTSVLGILWCAKMLIEKKVYLAKSSLDFALLILLASMILSTLTSLDKTSSLFGSYGRWFPSLFGFVGLYFFYYIVSTNLGTAKKVRTALYALIAGSALTSLFGIINYVGLVIPFFNIFNQKGFLLSGSSSALSAVALTGSVVALLMGVNVKMPVKKAGMLVAFVLNFIALSIFGGLMFAGASLVLIALGVAKSPSENLSKSKAYLFPVIGAVVMFLGVYYVLPQTKTILQREYPREVLPSTRESWVVSSTTLRDFPIFGSGVSTFYLNYPRYKTLSQNSTPTWNVNFDKPANEIFNIISTLGIFGLAAYTYVVITAVKMALKSMRVNDPYKGLSAVLGCGLLAALTSMALTYSSFQSAFVTFALMALLTAEAALNSNKSWAKVAAVSVETRSAGADGAEVETQVVFRQEVLQYIVTLPILALTAFGLYQMYLQYLPEFYIRKAALSASAQNVNNTYDYQVKAIAVNPQRSQYHRMYANTNLALAQSLAAKQDLTDQEKATVQNLLAQALRNVKFATENVNPLDSANWETRARVYRFLIPAAKDADQFAIQAYNTAIQLDPTNPTLRVELGGIYFSKEDYLSAGNLFKQATNLKNDYANAHYNLGHALSKLKAYADAKAEFETVQKLVSKDSKDYELVAADIESVSSMLGQVAGAESTKPSVEDLEQTGKKQTPSSQEPLKKAGEQPSATPTTKATPEPTAEPTPAPQD